MYARCFPSAFPAVRLTQMRHKLTKRYIDSLPPPENGEYIIWDTDLKRFGLRIKASLDRKIFRQRGKELAP